MPHQYVRRARRFNKNYGKPAIVVASNALQVARAVSKLVNVEYKQFDVLISQAISTTVQVNNMVALAQGDTFESRNGRKIKLFSWSVRGQIKGHASATNTNVRLVIVRDNLGSTTPPVIGDLFETNLTMGLNQHRLGDPQTNARFSVLYDRSYSLSPGAGTSIKQFQHYSKIESHVTFTGTAATNEGKGCLYSFLVSNEATNTPTCMVETRVKFIDN